MFFLFQNKTVLTFNHGKHTARFNVGSKLKVRVYEKYFFNLQFILLVTDLLCTTIRNSRSEKKLEPKRVPQVFLGSLPGRRRSAVGMVTGSVPSDSARSLCGSQLDPVLSRF